MTQVSAKLLFISVSGLDSSGMIERARAGRLPGLSALVAQGASGPLRAPYPTDSVACAATLSTGMMVPEHGMTLAFEPWPGGLRATGHASWKAAPIWSRLAEAGLRTASVGLPLIRPGAAWQGLHVDDRIALADGAHWGDWPLPRDVAPSSLRDDLRDLRVHPDDVSDDLLRQFVGSEVEIDRTTNRHFTDLAVLLARFTTVDAAAHMLMTEHPWDALFIHYEWPGSAIARYKDAEEPFVDVVEKAWTLLDAAILSLGRACPPETTIVLVSPGQENRLGVVIGAGPHIQSGGDLGLVQAIDIVPTLLALCGLRDPDLRGIARLGGPAVHDIAKTERKPRPFIENRRDIERLKSFGIAPLPQPEYWEAHHLTASAQLTLPHDPALASQFAEAALAAGPDTLLALSIVATVKVGQEDGQELPQIADRMAALPKGQAWATLTRAAAFVLEGELEDAAMQLRQVVDADGSDSSSNVRAAMIWLMMERHDEAIKLLDAVLEKTPDSIDALLARAAALKGQPELIEPALRRVLELDPAHPVARPALETLRPSTGKI